MKILVIADQDINKTDLGQITREIGELYQTNADITQEYVYETLDYGDYPVEQYWGGYYGIQHQWLREKCAEIYKRWAEEVVCVVFAISSNNWKLDNPAIVGDKPVWGWNHSNQMSGYGVQQVRIAQNPRHTTARNINNSVGTLYHELHHDHDTFIFVNTGITVESVVKVNNWDNGITHGGEAPWQYIRHKENQASIKAVAPLLREALAKRKELFDTKVGLYKKYISLLQQLRGILASQRGDLPILQNNKCIYDK